MKRIHNILKTVASRGYKVYTFETHEIPTVKTMRYLNQFGITFSTDFPHAGNGFTVKTPVVEMFWANDSERLLLSEINKQ